MEECGGTVLWNSETVEQCNSDGETVWWNGGNVMVKQCWWNIETVIVEQCGGTVEQ